ncbi:hypothetical protein OG599_33095 [Streptomyces sp. NBC_01335]|uniref:hypothetical protein n=1 Tax=Streptomyces sp. NBC_01335 TaxID=2903828 RepID=UPI002E14E226|nr:hypothetical protein OG599_33095 [Streptomyces sp. NBC_01335]
MREQRWARPAAGREPAAAALLAWLADAEAPRLCLVTGGGGSGKSALLAWLVAHGRRPGTPPERRVHAFVPLAGRTATTAAWTIAHQLSVTARTPGALVDTLTGDGRRTVVVLPDLHAGEDPEGIAELALALLESDHVRLIVEVRSGTPERQALAKARCAVMDLDEARWTDPARCASWAERPRRVPPESSDREPGSVPAGPVDLNDPPSVCTADPWHVSALYERSGDPHGGLRAAWLRAGASLTREQAAPERANVLLAALGNDADPRLSAALARCAEGARWRVRWRCVPGDARPPWPGPARALATGRGALDGRLVVTDHQGTIRVLDREDASPVGRLPASRPLSGALVVDADGVVTSLDAHGSLFTQGAPSNAGTAGLSALLDTGPPAEGRLVEAARTYVAGVAATALAACDGVLAVGDETGTVRAFTGHGGDSDGPEAVTAALHRGPVTALAATGAVPTAAESPSIPLVYSGGADGTVRVWALHGAALETPVLSRPHPVTALAVTTTEAGPLLAAAWADGLVAHQAVAEDAAPRVFRPGLRVNALALTSAGELVIGTDESLMCLAPSGGPPEAAR